MTAISQKIPNLFGGISQQPDEKKVPGQVRDLVNGYPEFSLGLIKRPGAKYENEFYDAGLEEYTQDTVILNKPTGKWFHINRDENEKYIGQFYIDTTTTNVTVPRLKIWRLRDGLVMFVDLSGLVDGNSTLEGLRDDALIAWTGTTSPSYVRSAEESLSDFTAEIDDYIVDCQEYCYNTFNLPEDRSYFKISNTYDYGDIYSSVYDGVVEISGDYIYYRNGQSLTSTTGYSIGNERTDDVPQLAVQGYKVYEIIEPTADNSFADSVPVFSTLAITWRDIFNSSTHPEYKNYIDEAKELNNALLDTVYHPSTYLDPNPVNTWNNSYFSGLQDVNNIEFLTDNDVTYVLNKEKVVEMDSTLSGEGDATSHLVVLDVFVPSTNYTINITGTDSNGSFSIPSTAGQVSGATLDALYNNIATFDTNGNISGGHLYVTDVNNNSYLVVERYENVYKITPASGVTIDKIEVVGPQDDAIRHVEHDVRAVTSLPLYAPHGYKVKVSNIDSIDIDDMWVRFEITDWDDTNQYPTEPIGTMGEGSWVECVAPGIKYKLNNKTLPHKLVRDPVSGHFKLTPIEWEDRRVGDETTNPDPSFVGKTINGMFFYRNRFGVLSGSNVCMTRANRLEDFWNKSAMAVGDDDPIDVTAVSTQPTDLSYVVPTAAGLLLFGTNEQFILNVGNDILAPDTAAINTISKYEVDTRMEALTMGTSSIFVSKTGGYLSLYEYLNLSTQQAPSVLELTNIAPELVPSTVDSITVSNSKSVISIGQTFTDTLYQYRFLRVGDKELATSWYKWKLPGKLVYQFFDNSKLYCLVFQQNLVEDKNRFYLTSFELNQQNQNGLVTGPDGLKFDPCLDMWTVSPKAYYDGNVFTKFYLPYTSAHEDPHLKMYAIVLDTADGKSLTNTTTYVSAGGINTVQGAVQHPATESEDVSVQRIFNVYDINGGYLMCRFNGNLLGRDVIFGYRYDMEVELPTFYLQTGETSTDIDSNLILQRINVLTGPSGPLKFNIDIDGIDTYTYSTTNTDAGLYKLDALNISKSDQNSVPIYQRNKNVTIKAIADSPLPANILSLSWEGRATNKYYRRG